MRTKKFKIPMKPHVHAHLIRYEKGFLLNQLKNIYINYKIANPFSQVCT